MNTKTNFMQGAWRVILALVFSLSVSGVSVQSVQASTYTVTNLNDTGAGSLRQAIIYANAHPGPDTITFSVSGTITLGSSLQISDYLTIDGSGQNVTISGNDLYQVMWINYGSSATLNQLNIIRGSGGNGGGVYNAGGTLTVTNCTFSSNNALSGGGIFSWGNLSVTKSTFSANHARDGGAGIYQKEETAFIASSTFFDNTAGYGAGIQNGYYSTMTVANSNFSGNKVEDRGGAIFNSGTMILKNSTFFSNSATAYGGAICNDLATLTVSNSTFSGNSAGQYGGGVFNNTRLTVMNSTFSGNSATNAGGGIYHYYGSLSLKNSILANSTSGGDCYSGKTLSADTNNLIESNSGCGTPVSTLDPKLGPLADNGGPTRTHALQAGSPAFDAGDDATCAAAPIDGLDQRGVERPRGFHCDIGSFELDRGTLTSRSVGAYDGWILESTENSGVGGTVMATSTTFNLGDETGDKQYRAILSFNTADLPDIATVVKVTLKINNQGLMGTNPFTILGGLKTDIQKPYFGTGLALAVSDFQAAAGISGVGTFGATPVNNWYSAVIGSAGYPNINKTGTTQFRLRFAKDDNDDGSADYLKFYSGNYATATVRPMLVIEYYVP